MFSDELKELHKKNLLRHIKDREALCFGSAGTGEALPDSSRITHHLPRICFDGHEHINFASNDYLGLAGAVSIREPAQKAMDKYGFGSGASRLLAGGTVLHSELERSIAGFKGTEAALVFNSGYTANISAIPSIAGEGDIIFSDEFNHASIVDGCRLSRAGKLIYRHRDPGHLSELLGQEKGRRKIIVTDTVFSMDGDIAPVREIYDICLQHQKGDDVTLYLDDAHGTGVLGGGKGALSHFGIKPEPWIIQMGTFSKALGSYGAFIAASRDITDWLINTARGFIYSTALPACTAAASLAALDIVRENPDIVRRLWQNRERLFNGIRDLGFDTLSSETPIIPISTGDVETAVRLSEKLLAHHIYAPAIRPPTVKIPRIRVTVTAAHTAEDIDRLLEALAEEKQ
ncbi:MAG: 8-amino-7-oxononanoate synthase [Nitrospirae bacterium]|nr:8-amino-7-oxononanoate synthase [Nitrospirota bacterium]MCL5238269.1 8-amino-7-oxononanoate synthase [Nitrospirota bacterium]